MACRHESGLFRLIASKTAAISPAASAASASHASAPAGSGLARASPGRLQACPAVYAALVVGKWRTWFYGFQIFPGLDSSAAKAKASAGAGSLTPWSATIKSRHFYPPYSLVMSSGGDPAVPRSGPPVGLFRPRPWSRPIPRPPPLPRPRPCPWRPRPLGSPASR